MQNDSFRNRVQRGFPVLWQLELLIFSSSWIPWKPFTHLQLWISHISPLSVNPLPVLEVQSDAGCQKYIWSLQKFLSCHGTETNQQILPRTKRIKWTLSGQIAWLFCLYDQMQILLPVPNKKRKRSMHIPRIIRITFSFLVHLTSSLHPPLMWAAAQLWQLPASTVTLWRSVS